RKAVRVELVSLGCSDRLSSALLGLPHVCTSFVPLWTAVISTLYRHANGTKGAQGRTRCSLWIGINSCFLNRCINILPFWRSHKLCVGEKKTEFLHQAPFSALYKKFILFIFVRFLVIGSKSKWLT